MSREDNIEIFKDRKVMQNQSAFDSGMEEIFSESEVDFGK